MLNFLTLLQHSALSIQHCITTGAAPADRVREARGLCKDVHAITRTVEGSARTAGTIPGHDRPHVRCPRAESRAHRARQVRGAARRASTAATPFARTRRLSGYRPTRRWPRSRDRLPRVEDPLDGMARVRGLTRQPERTIKEILHVPGHEVTLSSSVRAHIANVIDAVVLLGRRLPAARADVARGRRARDRSASRCGSLDGGALRAHRGALFRAARWPGARDDRIQGRAYVRRSRRWSKAWFECCGFGCGGCKPTSGRTP